MRSRIPFNRPGLAGNEYKYIAQAIAEGHISGDGVFSKRCHAVLEQTLSAPKVLLTTSCTHALEMAALVLEVQAGDEVIVPSFTFVSTVNAFVLRGARPIFCDIRPDTLNMDEGLLDRLITPQTKVIVPVHYGGVGCEMDTITEIAEHYGLAVVEGNAHGLFGKYRGQYLGTFGDLAAQSFHETKNFSCGEGGALIINKLSYLDRAEIIREKGTDRSRFFRGQVDKYTWVDIGSSYLPSDLLAAFLLAQLEARDQIQANRKRIWEYYYEHLLDWASNNGVRLPVVPDKCEQSYHLFYLIMATEQEQQALIQHLSDRGIMSVFHYLPLHMSRMGQHFGGHPGDCPVTETMSARLLRLPFYNDLSTKDQDYICATIVDFRP